MLFSFGVSLAQAATINTINRLAAQFRRFNSSEDFTSVTPTSGTPPTIYTKTIFVPDDSALYVRLYATGDSHSGTASLILCQVDGINCQSGTGNSAGFAGWVNLQRHLSTEDLHDNSVTYGWCAGPVAAGFHTVTLKLASLVAGSFVFLEQENFTIDAEQAANRCTLGSP
jgi:hypothetical protein